MSAQEENLEAATNTELKVLTYLENNPEFFNKYPALTAALKLPQEAGPAVSLYEKQLAVLREQNRRARRRLHELIEIARQNEALARRMHQLALTLMEADQPAALFSALYDNLRQNFQADRAVVCLFAEAAEAGHAAVKEFAGREVDEQALFKSIIDKRQPLCGRMKHQQQAFLFGDEGDAIASAVMAPLHGPGWGGILAIGSFDGERFRPGMGVELLANLGELLSFILKPWIKAA